MGIWGAGLYDNDCTCDIRDAFKHFLAQGVSPLDITKKIREEFDVMFRDEEEGPLAELALQEQLFQSGAIMKKDLIKILNFLNNGGDLDYWKEKNPDLAPERKKELVRLISLFQSPIPKLIRKKGTHISSKINWCENQVFAIPINGEGMGALHGEYLLLHVCGEEKKIDRYRIPKMRAKITMGKKLPQCADEFNALDYVQISCTFMKDRFRPFRNEFEVPQEFKQEYRPDEWGCLPEYTFIAYEYTNIHPPITMIYLGKWENILPPQYDFKKYPFPEGVAWAYIQEFIVDRFQIHNLRQAKYYKNQSGGKL